jgi:hypothetical protein
MKATDVSASASSLLGPLDQDVFQNHPVIGDVSPIRNTNTSGDGSYFSLSNSERNMYSEFDLLSSQLSHQSFLSATPVRVLGADQEQMENASTQLVSNSFVD